MQHTLIVAAFLGMAVTCARFAWRGPLSKLAQVLNPKNKEDNDG
jgi:hypothetical protein